MDTQRLRILIVEDHHDTAGAMRRLLQLEGHCVTIATSAAEALAVSAEDVFDVIVSDLQLPDGDGGEVVSFLRNRLGYIPAIAVTGIAAADLIETARHKGFCDYILKPITFEELRSAILACAETSHASAARIY